MPADMDALAGDHDFHVVSLTPSVTLMVEFDSVDEECDVASASFYQGQAHVCLKDSIFQASTAERHAVELGQLLLKFSPSPVLFAHTDGGPDHNCKHLSVQMSWLGFFLRGGQDMLVVSRVAPTQSWTNPAERVMGPLNLALQNMALARTRMGDDFEAAMKRCNGMSAVRAVAAEEEAARAAAAEEEAARAAAAEEEAARAATAEEEAARAAAAEEEAARAAAAEEEAARPSVEAPDSSAPGAQPESVTPAARAQAQLEPDPASDADVPDSSALPPDLALSASPEAALSQEEGEGGAGSSSSQSNLALLAQAAGLPIDDEMASPDSRSTPRVSDLADAMSEDDDDEGESSDSDSDSWELLGEGSGDDDDNEVELVEDDDEVELVENEEDHGGSLPPAAPLPAVPVVPGFKQTYRDSVSAVMSAVENQISRATWADRHIKVHSPATDEEVMGYSPLHAPQHTCCPPPNSPLVFPVPNVTHFVLLWFNRWVASLSC